MNVGRNTKPGTRVIDSNGGKALLLAVWAQYAWIVYDGFINPDTFLASSLTVDEAAESRAMAHAQSMADLRSSGGIVDAP